MKKTVLVSLFVFISFLANAQNWKSHPKKPYSGTDSCLVWQDSTKKFYRIKCSEINTGGSSAIDTTKVGRIEQGRGSTPFLLYFNGTAWVKNDTSYVPASGSNKMNGAYLNKISGTQTFGVEYPNANPLLNVDAKLTFSENGMIFNQQKNESVITGNYNIDPSTQNPKVEFRSRIAAAPNTDGSNIYFGLYAKDDGTGKIIANGSKVVGNKVYRDNDTARYIQLGDAEERFAPTSGTQSTALADGKIWIGDGTNTAFPRTLSGDVTVSNLGVTSYNGIVPSTKGGAGAVNGILKANGSGVVSAADSTSVYNAIGSKPANKFLASPSTTSGTVSARNLATSDLSYLYERIGVVISDNFSGTFSTNWNTTGSATATNSGGKMSITGTSTKSLDNYFLWKTYTDNNRTCATNTTNWFDVDIPASTTTSFGVGFRQGGTGLNISSCILLNTASRGKLVFYFNNDTSTAITSNAALSVTTGDVVTLKLTRTRNTFTLTARIKSGTNVNQEISHILNVENNNSTTYRTPNAGAVGIVSLGGNFTLDNYSYSIDDTKYNKVLVAGNSIASGSRSNSQSQTFPSRLGDLIGYSVSVNAGGGNQISSINATELLLYQPQIIILELGINNLLSGSSAATVKLSMDTLIAKLTGYTTSNNKLFILSLLPNNSVDVTATNALFAASYGTAFIDITKPFNNTSGTGINPYYSPDGVHPTSEGAFFIADCIFQKINPYLNISYNHKAYDNPVYRVNGNTSMGNYDQIANYACDIFKSNHTKQFRIGYTESSNDGLMAWSAVGRSHAVLAGGLYNISTTIYASDTASNRMSFNNGDIRLSANGGQTIGSIVTPTNRLQYTNSSKTWEHINSYSIFAGNNATTNGNTIYRKTNGGSDLNALVMFSNGVSTGVGATSSGIGLAGGYECYLGNGTRNILIGSFDFGGVSTAGSEAGFFRINTKPSTGSIIEVIRFDANQNVGIGTGATIAQRLDVWSTAIGSGIRNYNTSTLGSTSGGIFIGQSPIATAANQRQATFAGGGYDGGGTNSFASARMQVISSESQIFATNRGGYINFETTNSGTTTLVERMRIENYGTVGINTATPNSNTKLHVDGLVQYGVYTVSTLPTCNAGTANTYATVSDALTPTYLTPVVGGGAIAAPVFCNSSQWVTH